MECYCDNPPSVYHAATHTARTTHICYECGTTIQPGERYECVFGVWEGEAGTFKTCARCVDLREYVRAHVPCFCFEHGNTRENAIETARDYSDEAPGLLFGAYRRAVRINRARVGR